MEKNVKTYALRDNIMSEYMSSQKKMEINLDNVRIGELRKGVEVNKNDKSVKDLALHLYETALLTSWFSLDDPNTFADKIYKILKLGLSIEDDDETIHGEDNALKRRGMRKANGGS